MSTDPVNRLRKICLSLPEAIEKLSYGEPGWFVGNGPQFVSLPLVAGDIEDSRFGVRFRKPRNGFSSNPTPTSTLFHLTGAASCGWAFDRGQPLIGRK